jgi:hypothetical protein
LARSVASESAPSTSESRSVSEEEAMPRRR